jgi:hypothetical protein
MNNIEEDEVSIEYETFMNPKIKMQNYSLIKEKKYYTYFRTCRRCNINFKATGKYCQICESCYEKKGRKNDGN